MKTITISLSPNAERKDVLIALKTLTSPWIYVRKNYVEMLEQWFKNYFSVPYAISFASGRTALSVILTSLGIGSVDEVLLQSFTCVAVPNAVLSVGAKPVYVDILKNLTIDPSDLEKKISKKTKAIIVQHTFGIPADMEKIREIAKAHKLFVIEDAAHTIGGTWKGKKLGTFSDAAIFSFGRDKAFSSVFGGMAITSNKMLGKKMQEMQKDLQSPSTLWIIQQLLHPIAFFFILPLYDFFNLGKILLVSLQKLLLLSFPVFPSEKNGIAEKSLYKKMPNPLARLALFQLERVKRFNTSREAFVKLYAASLKKSSFVMPYKESAPLLRFPIFVKNRDKLMQYLKRNKIYAGNWYSSGIDPKDVDYARIFYDPKTCPRAQQYAREIVNLPTHPTLSINDAKRIIKILQEFKS